MDDPSRLYYIIGIASTLILVAIVVAIVIGAYIWHRLRKPRVKDVPKASVSNVV